MASNSPSEPGFDTAALWRLAIWGGAAMGALSLAIVVASSDLGARRLAAKPSPPAAQPPAQESVQKSALAVQIAARSVELEAETRRLAEAVRALNNERDRLVARVAALERNIEDLTGTIRRQGAAAPVREPLKDAGAAEKAEKQSAVAPAPVNTTLSPSAVPPAPAASPKINPPGPPTTIAPPSRSSAVASQPAETEPRGATGQPGGELPLPVYAKADGEPPVTELGVDIGGAASFDGLRGLWVATKSHHAGLLDELYPVVAVRENARSKSPELRLIVGPVENAEAAARICAKLSAARRYCQPVAFAGQRLARADAAPAPVPERKPAAPAPKQAQTPPQTPAPSSAFPWLFR